MSAFSRFLMAVGSAALAWLIYLWWFYAYIKDLSWFPYLMVAACFSMFIMFIKVVKRGETGHLELFGSDMKKPCKQGWYWPPSFAPFLQGWDLTLGFDIVLERWSTLGSVAGNPNIQFYQDQNLSNLQFRATTDSLVKANFFHDLNRLKNWLFSFRDAEGRVRYYKLGMVMYVFCCIFAFIGNIGNHALQAANYATNTINQTANAGISSLSGALGVQREGKRIVETYVQLDEGRSPIMPLAQRFVPINGTSNVQHYFNVEGDDREYYIYENTPETIFTLNVKQPMCAVVPPGERIAFVSDRPPKYALNMANSVLYRKKRVMGDLSEAISVLIDFHELPDTYPATASWKHVHDYWYVVVAPKYRMVARALPKEYLPEGSNGGIVCF